MGSRSQQGFADSSRSSSLYGRAAAYALREILPSPCLWIVSYGILVCLDRRRWAGFSRLGSGVFSRITGSAVERGGDFSQEVLSSGLADEIRRHAAGFVICG